MSSALPVGQIADAQQQSTATPAAIAVGAVVKALNGASADRAALVKSGFATDAFEDDAAAADELNWLDKIATESGGVTVISVAPQGERMAEAVLHTTRGDKFGKLVLFTDSKEPGKISNLFLLPARDPAKVRAETWPSGKLSNLQIAAAIAKRASALAAEDNFSGVVLVARGDQVILQRAYGFADKQWRIPNRVNTRFHIASAGKMFTAAAILKLAGQGRLKLDDPLSKWVPEYPRPEAARITLRQLLTHSSGVGEFDVREIRKPMTGSAIAATMTQPLEFRPGERFSYSNGGYILLQAAVEKATGKSFGEALRALVFDPAGMKDTGLWPVTAVVANRATGYLHAEDDPLGLGPRYSNEQFLGFGANGAGGEYSTAGDMFRFLQALATGKLLGAAQTKEMLAARMDFAGSPRPAKYGYGVDLEKCAGRTAFGHEGGGANSGVSSLAFRTLGTGWTIVVLSNYDPPAAGDLAFSICEFVAPLRS